MTYFQILSCSNDLGNCCSDSSIALLINAIKRIVDIIQIIIPILLIIFAAIEFFKLVVNPEKKNGTKHIMNMFISATIIFFIPIIVNVILNIMPQSFNVVACWNQAKTIAESSRNYKFEYINPYKGKEKKKLTSNSSDYEIGEPESENGDTISPGSAKGILEGAAKVHTMYEQQRWAYYSNINQLRWEDIKYSTNNPSKMTCCATFVGSAFYIGGVFPENVINNYNYNSQYGISKLCEEHGWKKITNYSQLAAGDVVIMSGPEGGTVPGHVQIYAGNGTWYNAGSTNAIQSHNPYASDASARFLYAWRNTA